MEGSILLFIQEHLRNEVLSPFLIWYTHLGNTGKMWIGLSMLLLIPKKTRKVGILSLIALIGSYVINNLLLKNLVARTRPYEVVPGLVRLIEKQKDLSFPSGHTGCAFAVATVCFIKLPKKYGIPILCLAFLMAFSRLYVGVHYPTDVLAGAMVSVMIAWTVCFVEQKMSQPKEIEKQA